MELLLGYVGQAFLVLRYAPNAWPLDRLAESLQCLGNEGGGVSSLRATASCVSMSRNDVRVCCWSPPKSTRTIMRTIIRNSGYSIPGTLSLNIANYCTLDTSFHSKSCNETERTSTRVYSCSTPSSSPWSIRMPASVPARQDTSYHRSQQWKSTLPFGPRIKCHVVAKWT